MTYPCHWYCPSRVAGLTRNIPKLILTWVVVYFSGHWCGWWAGLGGVFRGHAACRDVHTPVSADTETGGRHPGHGHRGSVPFISAQNQTAD